MTVGCSSNDDGALSDRQYVASCIGVKGEAFDPVAVLCTGSLDGSIHELGNPMTPGVGPMLSPDRQRIAFVDGDRVVIADTSGAELSSLDEPGVVSLGWLPDGSGLIVHHDETSGGAIERLDLPEGSTTVVLAADDMTGRVEQGIAVSPDGTQVAYASEVEEGWELRAVDVATGEQRVVFSADDFVYSPSWSPNGVRIAVVVGASIQLVDVRDGSTQLAAVTGKDVTTPTWSPDGKQLLFVDARAVLVRTDARRMNPTAIVDFTAPDATGRFPALPCWS